jgi:transcription antitermination factor NusG
MIILQQYPLQTSADRAITSTGSDLSNGLDTSARSMRETADKSSSHGGRRVGAGRKPKAQPVAFIPTTGPQWFVVKTAPQAEHMTILGLSEQGFRAWFPQIAVRQTRYGKSEKVTRPLFGGYIFTQFDPNRDPWGLVYRTAGVHSMLTNASGRPQPLRLGEIERLMSLGRAGDGVIDNEAPAFPRIAPGATVRATNGALVDWTGVCQWSTAQRLGVLMTMFGSERVVSVARSGVVAV